MSKLAKKPIIIPEGIIITQDGGLLEVKGKNAAISLRILPDIKISINDGKTLKIETEGKGKQAVSNTGTMVALVKNAIQGSTTDFMKELSIVGVGFKSAIEGKNLVLNVGFSHPVNFPIPENIKITADKNIITVAGHDKQSVGEVAAKIRAVRKPEPYQGTGIRYKDEVVRRKAGKKAAAASAGAK